MEKTLLLVEDDQFLSALLKARLVNEGYTVLYASDGDLAIKGLKEYKPDLMLMDLILPKRSGFEILETMRNDPALAKPPVMIISNLGQDIDINRARELGAVQYFIKARTPIDRLMTEVKKYFAGEHDGVFRVVS